MAETSQNRRPEPALLRIYLQDHLAGAAAGVHLARRLARGERATNLGARLDRLADEIADDRRALAAMMGDLGIPERQYKILAARAAEFAGRLKLNGHVLSRSPLSTVEELEMLRLGIEGKASAYRTLRTLGERHGIPDPPRLDHLIGRARDQAAEIEDLRTAAVATMIGPADSDVGRGLSA